MDIHNLVYYDCVGYRINSSSNIHKGIYGEVNKILQPLAIRPLKPSKEFLLKNGFEELRRNLFEMEYNNQYRIRVRKDTDNVWFLDVANMFRQYSYVNLSTQIEYVHNIQQILRGVGLDTLANAFKP